VLNIFGVLLVLFRYTVNPRLLLWACRHGNRALAASSGTRGRTATAAERILHRRGACRNPYRRKFYRL